MTLDIVETIERVDAVAELLRAMLSHRDVPRRLHGRIRQSIEACNKVRSQVDRGKLDDIDLQLDELLSAIVDQVPDLPPLVEVRR